MTNVQRDSSGTVAVTDADQAPAGVPESESIDIPRKATPATPAADAGSVAEPQTDGDAGDGDGQPEGGDKPAKPTFRSLAAEERIGELTRDKYDLDRRLRAAEQELARLRQGGGADEEKKEPTPDQFKTYEEFVDARADWRAQKAVATAMAERDEREARAAVEAEANKARSSYERALPDVLKRYPDYHAVVDDMPTTRAMAQQIVAMEKGHDVAYYLGKNPEEALRIAKLPLVKQGYELAKIEAKVAGTAPAARARTETNAPEPIKPVKPGATGNPAAGNKDPAKAGSMAEYARLRNAQLKEERKRGGVG